MLIYQGYRYNIKCKNSKLRTEFNNVIMENKAPLFSYALRNELFVSFTKYDLSTL